MIKFKFFKGKTADYELAMRVRNLVFVHEQNVPQELEKDEFDSLSWHIIALYGDEVIATGRIYTAVEKLDTAKLGRVAVMRAYRGRGIGRKIVNLLINKAKELKCSRIEIHAQSQVEAMYKKLGFKTTGSVFEEAGIKHVPMELQLTQ